MIPYAKRSSFLTVLLCLTVGCNHWSSGIAGMGGAVGAGGVVNTGGTMGGGGTVVPELSVFVGVPDGEGSADGIGAAARFSEPLGVAVDGAGNLFVADDSDNTIRKITPDGVVTTLAGTAYVLPPCIDLCSIPNANVDGTGAAARFSGPSGVAVDRAGNVFVADTYDNTIRKITPDGVVTTLAGTASLEGGSMDGKGAAASFYRPFGVAVDGADNVFVADSSNNTIRKITPDGVVTTLAGTAGSSGSADGVGAAARFCQPEGVAVDGTGNVFVADTYNHAIRKITPDGVVTTLAGTPGSSGSADGTASAARFSYPSGVAVDGAGNVFVADSSNNTIREITPEGVVITLAGTAGSSGSADGVRDAARFWHQSGLAVDETGNVFVADSGNSTIRKITPDGLVTTLAGTAFLYGSADGTGSAARFNNPWGVAVDGAGNVFVADWGNDTIRKITPDGVVSTLAGLAGTSGSLDGMGAAASFNGPRGVAVDGAGNVFVADSGNNTIRKITPAGMVATFAGTAGLSGSTDGTGAAASFNFPTGVAVDGAGDVFVADSYNCTIRKIAPTGVVTTFAGTGYSGTGSADGPRAAASFTRPEAVAVDGAGNLFIADPGNNTIRKITPDGMVATLAGTAGSSGSADGTGAAASFNLPLGVGVDGAGNVFVADVGNNAIRAITPAGVVSTVVGVAAATPVGNFPGPLPASIVSPYGVAIDSSSGSLYVTLPEAVMVAALAE
jgi:hypothetical protein